MGRRGLGRFQREADRAIIGCDTLDQSKGDNIPGIAGIFHRSQGVGNRLFSQQHVTLLSSPELNHTIKPDSTRIHTYQLETATRLRSSFNPHWAQ